MKKKLFIVVMILVVLTLKEVNATEFSAYLPGGKNYLDPLNMVKENNYFWTEDNMLVKPNTEYTLSFPGYDMLGNDITFEILGPSTSILGTPADLSECTITEEIISCTFTTGSTEEFLYFEIDSSQLSLFYSYYGLQEFQLEEGSVVTDFEEYIPPFSDTTTPEFSGVGAYITSYQSNESISSIIDNHILAIDDIDGDISENIIIVSDAYTTNEQTVGEYDVLLSVSDNSGNEAFFTLTVMVKDEIQPVIVGPLTVHVSVESTLTITDIINDTYNIYDECDPSPSLVVTTDGYTSHKDVLGIYLVSFDVIDESLNTRSKTFSINVLDYDYPVLISSSVFESNLSSPINLADVINSLVYTDNYDDLSGVVPTLVTDYFSGNELSPGTYTINVEVEDSSGNILNSTLTINVSDDVLPNISGPVSYSGSYEIEQSLNDFINMLSVSDNVDFLSNSDLYIITDTYSSRTTKIGNFVIIFGVMDSSGNERIHQLDINIFDDVAPVIYVDNYVITVNLSATFNEEDALKLLLNSRELATGNYVITKLIDEYTGNENNPGTYIYRLLFQDDEGNTFEKEFLVKVTDTNTFNYETDLLPRNLVVYTSMFGYLVFIIIKKRKITI